MVRQMDIILSNSSGKPIYEQISDQVKSQILSGTLAAGDALPSMRLLAKELHISVITTKRAYEELEREGFLQNIPGKGCCGKPSCAGWRSFSPRRWTRPERAASPWKSLQKRSTYCIKVTDYDKQY